MSYTGELNSEVEGVIDAVMPIIGVVIITLLMLPLQHLGLILALLMTDPFWGPMAYAMMGRLPLATVLTVLFVPALYAANFRVYPTAAPPPPV